MSTTPTISGGWSRRKFWSIAGILFAAQAGLIMLFGGVGHDASQQTAPAQFVLLDGPTNAEQLSKMFFARDPSVFPLPSSNGFSGRAWLNLATPEFEVPEVTEAPAWLALNPGQLGTNFPSLSHARSPLPPVPVAQNDSEAEPWPVALVPELLRSQSVFEIRGDLEGRQLKSPVTLPVWPGAQLLRKNVVQIAVNSAGQVVAARLEEPRSGSVDADRNALQIARSLRFRPAPASPPVWGEAVFEWQTVEPTNAKPVGGP